VWVPRVLPRADRLQRLQARPSRCRLVTNSGFDRSIRFSDRSSTLASPARVQKTCTLEEFLRLPEIDEHPYLEYSDGRIEAKVSPQKKHSSIETKLAAALDAHAEREGKGGAFVELRCSFAGRSMIPDVVFLLEEHIETDPSGEVLDQTLRPPDIHVEIVSPDQSVRKCREKLAFSTANGCPLGWLIDPTRRAAHVYRPGRPPARLPDGGALLGARVLPGFRLSLAELFGWLKRRRPNPPSPQS
jgi:Uma2 family endonuclease